MRASRISPLSAPYEPAVRDELEGMMPAGAPPILLFRTFAKNLAMMRAMRGWGSYELSPGLSLTMRDREILIDRTCARCGCEYEWGVHVTFFAARAGLDAAQVRSLTAGTVDDVCWESMRDRMLIRAADALHDHADLDDSLAAELLVELGEESMLDLLMLCGWYHAISFCANGARVAQEPGSPSFADVLGS
jgi:hypothetical protein